MVINIRHANVKDAEEILELQKLAYQSEAIIYNDWSIPPLTQTLEKIKEEFAENTFLKACESDKIVGSVKVSINNENYEIGRLIVHPALQGKGIGTQLMLAVEAEFPMAKRFELFTGSKSVRNIHLYEKLGYKIFTRKQLSELVELVFMEKYQQ